MRNLHIIMDSGFTKIDGSEIDGHQGQSEYAMQAKLDSKGLGAVHTYLDNLGYPLGLPVTIPYCKNKPLILYAFSNLNLRKIDPGKLEGILREHALSDEQAANENLLFGVTYAQFRALGRETIIRKG